mmetsp:Transcript_103690/g.293086  ORF Transcript_103690/g.293086 Transcript_103690/m.293086 type:complete len:217 (-) Transcript_103690:23-673(-)
MYSFGGWCGGTLDAVALETTGVATHETATRQVTESSQLRTCSRKPVLLTLSVHVSMRVCALQLASTLARARATLGALSKALWKLTSTYLSAPSLIASCGHIPMPTEPHCRTAGEVLAIQDMRALLVTDDSQVPALTAKLRLPTPRHSDWTLRWSSPCASSPARPSTTSGVQAKGSSKPMRCSSASESRPSPTLPSDRVPSCTDASSEVATQETLTP